MLTPNRTEFFNERVNLFRTWRYYSDEEQAPCIAKVEQERIEYEEIFDDFFSKCMNSDALPILRKISPVYTVEGSERHYNVCRALRDNCGITNAHMISLDDLIWMTNRLEERTTKESQP